MNLHKLNQQGNDGGNGDGGNADNQQQQNNNQNQDNQQNQGNQQNSGRNLSDADLQALAALMKGDSGNKNNGSDYSDHENQRKQQQQKDDEMKNLTKAIKFNQDAANVITENKSLFQSNTIALLDKKYDSEQERAEQVQKFSARDFFTNEANLTHLKESDRDEIKRTLLDSHNDISMTGARAWSLVEDALHIMKLKNDNDRMKNFGGGNTEQSEALKAFDERIYAKN